LAGEIDSLDPHWQFDGYSLEAQVQVYEAPIGYAGGSLDKFEPLLATAVPSRANGLISADGLTYRFPIRKGVKFHDGSALTPEDARYSLLRALLMDRAGGSSFLLAEPLLGKAETDDGSYAAADAAIRISGDEVRVTLKAPYAPFLSILATHWPVVSKAFVVKNGGWDGSEATWLKFRNQPKQDAALYDKDAGTGPFKLERWDRQTKQLYLARFDGYWRAPAALAHVVYKTVNETSTRKLMLQAGDADAAIIERGFLPQVQALPGVKVLDDEPLLEVHNVFVPTLKLTPQANPYLGSGKLDGRGIPPDFFADADVRLGFAYAFEYDAYIRDGYRGKGSRARGPIPKGVLGHNPAQPVREFSPEKAAAHFKKAFGGKLWEAGFTVPVIYMEGRADRQLACQILKKNVEALSPKFRVDVRALQWSMMLDAFSARKLPMINGRWVLDFPDPHNAVFPFLGSDGYYAKAQGYSNPKADALLEAARGELDPKKRRALYFELQKIAHDDAPQIYTLDTYNVEVLRDWVKGWTYNPILLYGYLYPVHKSP
jgi:peptide/nickel transport system substrate-binding protein